MHLDDEQKEEAELNALLRRLDHPPPRIDAADIVARAQRQDSYRLRWVAALLLAAVAGSAAIALPGSPVRGWLGGTVERITIRSSVPQKPAPADSDLAGVAIAPGKALEIVFTSRQPSGEIRVTLTDDSDVFVRTETGAATFASDPGRLVIDNKASAAAFEIRIPRSAQRVEIRVEGVRVFLKQSAGIAALAPASADGAYVLRLSR